MSEPTIQDFYEVIRDLSEEPASLIWLLRGLFPLKTDLELLRMTIGEIYPVWKHRVRERVN